MLADTGPSSDDTAVEATVRVRRGTRVRGCWGAGMRARGGVGARGRRRA